MLLLFFACLPDLPAQEFCSYLADYPHFWKVEAASCEGLVTECKVCDMLKQVGLNKSPGLDGFPYEVYLRMSHISHLFWHVFNHWFAQGVTPGSITKGVITLLKKCSKHVWDELDDYRVITQLNTELGILAGVLSNCLQIVISNLIGPEQNYSEEKIDPGQFAFCLQGARRDRGWQWSHTNKFRSVQDLWQGWPLVFYDGFGDCRIQARILEMD